jgi:hypothetical protein
LNEKFDPSKSLAASVKRAIRRVIDQIAVDTHSANEANKVTQTVSLASASVGPAISMPSGGGAVGEREHSELMHLLGNDGNALHLARAFQMAATVHIKNCLNTAGLDALPHHIQCRDKLWQALFADLMLRRKGFRSGYLFRTSTFRTSMFYLVGARRTQLVAKQLLKKTVDTLDLI